MTQDIIPLFTIGIGIVLFYAFKFGNKRKQKNITTEDIVELKYFGKIHLNKTTNYIDVLNNINGNKISIDLNIFNEKISKKTISPTILFLKKLSKIEKIAHRKILSGLKDENVVKKYINHHIEAFNEEDFKSLGIATTDNSENKKNKLLSKIHLKRIGIYPEEWENMVLFDYTINDNLTQSLIVLNFNSAGEFVDMNIES